MRAEAGFAIFGFAGVALASNVLFQHANNNITADIELLASGLGFGFMNILFKRYFHGKELLSVNRLQLLGGIISLAVWALLTEPLSMIKWNTAFIGSVLWIGLPGTAIAYTLWFILLSRYKASSMGVYMFLIIVVALIASFFLYDETINAVQFLGIAIIIISIYVVNRNDEAGRSRSSALTDAEGTKI